MLLKMNYLEALQGAKYAVQGARSNPCFVTNAVMEITRNSVRFVDL